MGAIYSAAFIFSLSRLCRSMYSFESRLFFSFDRSSSSKKNTQSSPSPPESQCHVSLLVEIHRMAADVRLPSAVILCADPLESFAVFSCPEPMVPFLGRFLVQEVGKNVI